MRTVFGPPGRSWAPARRPQCPFERHYFRHYGHCPGRPRPGGPTSSTSGTTCIYSDRAWLAKNVPALSSPGGPANPKPRMTCGYVLGRSLIGTPFRTICEPENQLQEQVARAHTSSGALGGSGWMIAAYGAGSTPPNRAVICSRDRRPSSARQSSNQSISTVGPPRPSPSKCSPRSVTIVTGGTPGAEARPSSWKILLA